MQAEQQEPVVVSAWEDPKTHFLRMWCGACRQLHRHGEGDGHRWAHCHVETSPYIARGYVLQRVGTEADLKQKLIAGGISTSMATYVLKGENPSVKIARQINQILTGHSGCVTCAAPSLPSEGPECAACIVRKKQEAEARYWRNFYEPPRKRARAQEVTPPPPPKAEVSVAPNPPKGKRHLVLVKS